IDAALSRTQGEPTRRDRSDAGGTAGGRRGVKSRVFWRTGLCCLAPANYRKCPGRISRSATFRRATGRNRATCTRVCSPRLRPETSRYAERSHRTHPHLLRRRRLAVVDADSPPEGVPCAGHRRGAATPGAQWRACEAGEWREGGPVTDAPPIVLEGPKLEALELIVSGLLPGNSTYCLPSAGAGGPHLSVPPDVEVTQGGEVDL